MRRLTALTAALVVAAATLNAVAGPDWEEGSFGTGDAGRLPADAQFPQGPPLGDLDTISGQLEGLAEGGEPDFQDMYAIWILTPTFFSASTESFNGGFASFDTQLWLFDADGFGLLGVDGPGLGATMGFESTDGTGVIITTPGLYYLAISPVDSDPVNGGGLPLFDQAVLGEVSGPDGLGGADPIADWTPPTTLAGGEYVIALSGTAFVPAPGAGLLLLLGAGWRRRQR